MHQFTGPPHYSVEVSRRQLQLQILDSALPCRGHEILHQRLAVQETEPFHPGGSTDNAYLAVSHVISCAFHHILDP